MVDIDDTESSFTIKVTAPPVGKAFATIETIVAPLQAVAGSTVSIIVKVRNTGTAVGDLYYYIINALTGAIVDPKKKTFYVGVDELFSFSSSIIMSSTDFKLKAIAGHVE